MGLVQKKVAVMIKKLSLLGAMLALVLNLSAATRAQMLEAISLAGTRNTEVKTDFNETRAMPRKEKVTLKGTLLYRSPDFLDMVYEDAEKEHFCIDGKKMTNRREGREVKSDLSKNLLMRGLANTLLHAFSGQVEKIADEQNTTLAVSEEADGYHVVLDARKKQPHGYSHIEIIYRKSDGRIALMQMDEFNGASTLYSLAK